MTLRLAAADAIHRTCGGLGTLPLVYQPLLDELQRFPCQTPNPFRVLASQLEPIRQAFDRVVGRRRHPSLALCHLAPQHLTEQPLLVAEVMVKHPLVDASGSSDIIHSRSG